MTKAIYPGTFDPITRGHVDVIKRSADIFEHVDVVVGFNPKKKTLFDVVERVALIKSSIKESSNVTVSFFDGLTVDYLKKSGAKVVIRGLRAISDFEFEFQMALMNKKLFAECETVYLMPSENFTYLNSSIIREIAELGGDVSEFVTPEVEKALKLKFNPKKQAQ